MTLYQTDVSQVCPVSGPIDCVQAGNFVRTPLQLPADMRAGNVILNPNGNQLAVVGHLVGEDVIAVVTMPSDNDSNSKGNSRRAARREPATQIGQRQRRTTRATA